MKSRLSCTGLVVVLAACGPQPGVPTTGTDSTDGTSATGEPTTTLDPTTLDPTTSEPTTSSSSSTTTTPTTGTTSTTDTTTGEPHTSTGTTGARECAVVEFADANLEGMVRTVLKIPDGPIAGDVLAALTELAVLEQNTGPILDLGGLECATGLIGLGLHGYDELGDAGLAPLASLTKLEDLRLTGSGISSLAVLSGLTELRNLELYDSGFTDLAPLAGLVELRSLQLNRTPVADLTALAGLTALEELFIEDTLVTDLTPLAGLTALRLLDASGTPVADLTPLSGLTAMEELDLEKTKIADLAPLAGMSELASLNVRITDVADLAPLAGLPIRTFSAASCHVEDITPVATWPTPRSIHLDDNQIVSIAPLLGAGWLVDDRSCGLLSLSGNPLAPAAELDAQALCDSSLVEVITDITTCGGTPGCFMP